MSARVRCAICGAIDDPDRFTALGRCMRCAPMGDPATDNELAALKEAMAFVEDRSIGHHDDFAMLRHLETLLSKLVDQRHFARVC